MKKPHVSFKRARLCFNLIFICYCLLVSLLFADFPASRAMAAAPQTIKVVMDDNYPPYVFRDSNGQLVGILIDQWALWEKKTGIRAEITGLDWSDAQERMMNGEFDVIDTIFRNPERELVYDFSKPYAQIDVSIFFHSTISGINDIKSLKGFVVGVKRGDNASYVMHQAGITDQFEFPSYAAIIDAAKDQRLMVFVMDKPPALYYLYKTGLRDQFRYTAPLESGRFHRAVKKGNLQMLGIVENGFSAISRSEVAEIDRKWFGTPTLDPSDYTGFLIIFGFVAISVILFAFWNYTLRITVRKKTAELTASEAKYRELLSNLSVGVIVYARNGIPVLWNTKALESLGLTAEQLVGKSAPPTEWGFISADGYPSDPGFNPGKVVLETKQPLKEFVLGVRRPSQTPVWLQVDAFPDLDGNEDIRQVIVTFSDLTERRKAEEHLVFLSFHDVLTNVYNRTYFEEELRRLDSRRSGSVALVIVDVDGLKIVNDTFGHEAGDKLLVGAASFLVESFRQSDMVSRIGGDEFAVILHNVRENEVADICRRFRHELESAKIINGLRIPLQLSYGYAVSPDPSVTSLELFRLADNRMYRDKVHRRGTSRGAIVQTLKQMLAERDYLTEDHAERIQDLVVELGQAVGLPASDIPDLRLFAQFHDIGKVGISDRILNKPGTLTPEERIEIQRHCEIGHRIAQSSPELLPIAEWILRHQEWWNGSGYPLGIRREEIPIQCRILSIIDAYDAMTSDRPYRAALLPEAALEELQRYSGTQFDPHLVPLFIQLVRKGK